MMVKTKGDIVREQAAKLGLEVVDKPVRAEELRKWYSTTLPWTDGVRVKRTKKED
jgi:hypothetical protein